MHAKFISLRRNAGLIAGLGLALCSVGAVRGAAAKEADAFPTFDSYIKITGKAASVSGNEASYAERARTPESGAYGIQALHLSKDYPKDVTLEVDGKALLGAEDYLGKFKLTKNEVGSVEVGYKRFRTFYDGVGGFFPKNNAWFALSNEELHTDRANFWADITIAMPNKPVYNLRYTNEARTGRKDSTIWGDTDFTGIPIYNVSSLNPVSANKKLIPSVLDLSERQRTIEGSVKHTVENTDFEFVVSHTHNNSDDTRWMNRYPNELKPWPLYRTNQPAFLVDPSSANNFTYGYDTQMTTSNIWNVTGKFETRLTDIVTAFGGISYFDAKADIGGDRQMKLVLATGGGVVQAVGGFVGASGRPAYSYKTTDGETSQDTLTANLGLRLKPSKDTVVTLALKFEDQNMDGFNTVTYNSTNINQTTGALTPVNVVVPNLANRSERSWVPELDFRTSPIAGMTAYGTLDYRYAPGDDFGNSGGVTTGGGVGSPVISYDNTKLNQGHYKVGINWDVAKAFTLRFETFLKDHTNKYTGYDVSAGSAYVLGYTFHGYKLTGIVKLNPTLTVTGRYVGQIGTMETAVDDEENYRSMDAKNHMFGASVDWNPNKTVYFQANVNYVLNTMKTGYPSIGLNGNDVLRDADNNYTSGNVVTGFAVDKKTNAQLEYTFYRADNYDPLAPPSSVAYGAGLKEYTVTAGVKRVLTDRMVLNAKVGYIDSKSDTTGGNTSFKGPVAYLAIDYSL